MAGVTMRSPWIQMLVFWMGGVVCAASWSAAQRDTPVALTTGTAEISGAVTTAGASPAPIRHAIVTIRGDARPAESTVTDDAGRFVFARLPAGKFTVSVVKPAYLPIAYGAKRSGNPGTPLSIAAGQHADVTLAMLRGAVIAGTVTDPAGAPLVGAEVAAVNLSGDPQTLLTSAPFSTTDDRGAYRAYGLPPGDYAVVVLPRLSGNGPITAPTVEQMDATLAELVRRQEIRVRQPGTTPNEPALPTARGAGIAPVYFPGTPDLAGATRLRVAPGDERLDVSFAAAIVPLSTIVGTVIGASTAVTLSIIPDGPRPPFQFGVSTPVLSLRPDAQGRFEYTNVAPGRYRIVGRAGGSAGPPPGSVASAGGSGGAPGNRPADESGVARPYSFGVADVEVGSDQQATVSLTLMPAGVFSGRIRFEAERLPVPADLSRIRVQLNMPGGSYSTVANNTNMGNAIISVSPVTARADGTFEMGGVAPGRYLVTSTLPADAGQDWWLRSVMAGGRDLLDQPPDFVPGQDLADVVITFTDRRTELAGMIQAADGQPAPDHFVLVFSQDRSTWRPGSRRLKLVRPSSDGRFSIAGLPPGEYRIAALADVDGNEWQRPDFLDSIVPAAIAVTLGEGERKTQDLRIR